MFPGRTPLPAEMDDVELVRLLQAEPGRTELREELFGRYTRKVAGWCLRIAGSPEEAQDIAQEVFLLVHERLESFRGESRFSTWLYTVARRVALNRARSEAVRRSESLDLGPEPVDDGVALSPEDSAERQQIYERLEQALREDLTPVEAEVLMLHYAHGVSLAELTERFRLDNKSGAKAVIVSARRKLDRRFGRWLGAQTGGRPWS